MASLKKIKEAIEKEEIKLFEYSSFGKLKFLGEGGFGDVYQACSEARKEVVALKKVRDNQDDKTCNKEKLFLQLINNEICLDIAHPDTQEYCMVLQFANNEDLGSYLQKHFSKLDWKDKFRMAKEISRGISCLHSANIAHRDLHDKNILVHNGRMIIADFGLSKSLGTNSISIDGGHNNELVVKSQ
ncbi:765_t:CDS:2, partial [Racocetra persica]